MNQRGQALANVWIRNPDSLGNPVDGKLVEAAHRVWDRARLTVLRYLDDDAEAGEILETAVDCASRAMANGSSIEFLEPYLLRSVARESIRRYRRDRRLVRVDDEELERLAGATSPDVDRPIDRARQAELLRACFDERGRLMYDLRVLDVDWPYIAQVLGYANATSAQVQFNKKAKRALARYNAHHGSAKSSHDKNQNQGKL